MRHRKRFGRLLLAAAAALAWFATAQALAATPSADLVGVWGAKRHFGPEVRGTLDITRSGTEWQAHIAQFDPVIGVERNRLSFELPANQGKFAGRLGTDNVIRGHWVQPPTVNDGAPFASLVILKPVGRNRWQGEIVPREDDFTLYLVFSRNADGSLAAFILNPERNIGLRWSVDRVEQDGDRVKLVGKFFNRGNEVVLGEGRFYPEEKRLTFYFPNRGGSYDFTPVGNDPRPGFHARGINPAPYEYRPPSADDDGWRVGTLADVGMVPEPIGELVRSIDVMPASVHDLAVHGVLVARHGKLVVEEYFHGFHRRMPHETRSAAKSVAATLVGAAIENGAKLKTSTRVYDLIYHGVPPTDMDPRKADMTVEHLLTMASGYDCDDWAGSRPGSEETLLDDEPDPDYYRYTLQLPMELAPGRQAVYCSINPNLLGAVLAAATHTPLPELFSDLIAEPLQIRRYYLNLQPTGEPYLGGGMKFLPRDFMKFGQLMLDGGVWNGKRILGKAYARHAGSPLVTLRGAKDTKYGYLWWTIDFPYKDRTVAAYFASGNGGQEVVVIPELDMVIACYGGNYGDAAGWAMIREYIPKFILAAVVDESR